jgi:regulator of sigma E protease
VVALDKIEVASISHLEFLSEGRAGTAAVLTVERGGVLLDVEVKLPVNGVDPDYPCLIGKVDPKMPAGLAGLKPRDRVVEVDGQKIVTWGQFVRVVRERADHEIALVVEREGQRLEFSLRPEYDREVDRARIGVELGIQDMPPWLRFKHPMKQLTSDAAGIWRVLSGLLNRHEAGNVVKMLGGPVAIFGMLWYSIQVNIFNALAFLRFLNINLAILNLLPIPVLDGGHIVFSLWEGITRRKAHPKLVNVLVNVFAILLICAFVLLTIKDAGLFRKLSVDEEETELSVTNPPPSSAAATNQP